MCVAHSTTKACPCSIENIKKFIMWMHSKFKNHNLNVALIQLVHLS